MGRRRAARWAVLAIVLATPGCKKEAPAEATASSSGGVTTRDATPVVSSFDRIAPAELTAFGAQPGFVEGGMIHAAIRPVELVAWLRRIPLSPEIASDLAELSREIGIDGRAEDLQRRFALTPDGVISMTLLRPISTGARDVRGELARGGLMLQAMARVYPELTDEGSVAEAHDPSPAPTPPAIEPAPGVAPPISPTIEPIAPPAIPPEMIEEARTTLRRAGALGLHSRVVVPVTEPEFLLQWLSQLLAHEPSSMDGAVEMMCRTLPDARRCFVDEEIAVIARVERGAVVIDVVLFVLQTNELDEPRSQAIHAALDARTLERGTATELRGDAAASLDAAAIVAFAELEGLHRALRGVRWDNGLDASNQRRLDGIEAIERLASAPMLFTGVRLELDTGDDDRLHAELRWIAAPDRRADNDALLTAGPARATVPSYDGLCSGAVACLRTRGVPKPSSLSDRLATGVWASSPREFENTFERNEEIAAAHLFAASWPNLLGAVARWPALEVGSGPEAAVVRNLVDVIGRVEGFGGSLRSFSIGRRTVMADYVVYARTTAQDAGIVRGMLSLAQQTMSEITLAGVDGPLLTWTIPEDELPATIVSRIDPVGLPTAQPEHGWIALVDGADRMGWLLGLTQESPEGPPAYLEIPDLGRALPTEPEIERELGFLRAFCSGLRLRAMLDVDAGEPRVTAVLSRG